ncbi:MAG: hypothetical protein GF311_11090 [Candidatus Lokiarchaeota archaeon]|nr:hypothetical protein [Candidatus Lokiarchaeota archaeon]
MQKRSITHSINKFTIELYSQLKEYEENLFFSPFSIYSALTMVYIGAKDETKEELEKLLHITISQRRIPLEINKLVNKLKNNKNVEVRIANSIWVDQFYELLESFIHNIDSNYNGELFHENFDNVGEVCHKLNKWVKKNTNEKIKSIISPLAFDPDFKLILLNAIYFNGLWVDKFDENKTKEHNFYPLNGNFNKIPMMHQITSFPYYETENLQIIKLDYKKPQDSTNEAEFSMIILLPKEKDGIRELQKTLSLKHINHYLEKLIKRKVKIYLPKFKLESKYKLKKTLNKMGMTNSFSKQANFSGIADPSNNMSPFIGEVVHKGFIDVNEKGTEAAAATMITMAPKAIPFQQEIPVFKVDHPFLFFIWDSTTQAIIFMSQVLNL